MTTDIILFCAGIAAGIVNAVAGGGVLFVFAALMHAGLSPLSAAMSSTAATWPGAVMAIFGYRNDLHKVPKKYFLIVIPSFLGAGIGAFFLTRTPGATFETIVPWLVMASVLLFAFQPQLHRHIHKPAHLRIKSPFTLLLILIFITALYGGYFGAGFGFIILAILGFTHLKNIYQINGMKNLITASISCACMFTFAAHGGIVWDSVLYASAGSVIGGLLGARIAHRLSPHITRIVIIGLGTVIVCGLLSRSL